MRSRRLWAAPRHHRHARHWLRRAGGWPRQRGRSAGMSDMGSWLLFCNASRTFWKLFDSCCPPPLPPTFSARKGWTVKPTHSCVQGDDNPNGGVALGGPLRSEHTVSLGARSAPAGESLLTRRRHKAQGRKRKRGAGEVPRPPSDHVQLLGQPPTLPGHPHTRRELVGVLGGEALGRSRCRDRAAVVACLADKQHRADQVERHVGSEPVGESQVPFVTEETARLVAAHGSERPAAATAAGGGGG